MTSRLISAYAWTDVTLDVLGALGCAVCADRVCLFENFRRTDGRLTGKLVVEWCATGVEPVFSMGPGQEEAYGGSVLPFAEDLPARGTMHGDASDFDEPARLALEHVGVRFVVASAVESGERWWGTLSVQYCGRDPQWSDLDREILAMVASALGSAVTHRAPVPAAAHYRELVEELPAILYIDDLSHQYRSIYVGPHIEAIPGISGEVWLNKDDAWEHNMHPDDWAASTRQYAEFLSSGTAGPLVQEYRMIRPDDGRIGWIRDESRCSMSTSTI